MQTKIPNKAIVPVLEPSNLWEASVMFRTTTLLHASQRLWSTSVHCIRDRKSSGPGENCICVACRLWEHAELINTRWSCRRIDQILRHRDRKSGQDRFSEWTPRIWACFASSYRMDSYKPARVNRLRKGQFALGSTLTAIILTKRRDSMKIQEKDMWRDPSIHDVRKMK